MVEYPTKKTLEIPINLHLNLKMRAPGRLLASLRNVRILTLTGLYLLDFGSSRLCLYLSLHPIQRNITKLRHIVAQNRSTDMKYQQQQRLLTTLVQIKGTPYKSVTIIIQLINSKISQSETEFIHQNKCDDITSS